MIFDICDSQSVTPACGSGNPSGNIKVATNL